MMMKEHIVDNCTARSTTVLGNGCLGRVLSARIRPPSIFPGLLDGIQPSCDFPDLISTGLEVNDCVLL